MLDLKLRPPPARSGQVHRGGVLKKLHALGNFPNIAIIAPPGYGKTTVMGQLQKEEVRSSAWLTLDEADSDPAILVHELAEALIDAGLIKDPGFTASAIMSSNALTQGVNEVLGALDPSSYGVLFLDQVDHLSTQSSLDVLGALLTRHPESLQVVFASRGGERLPLPLLRSRGLLGELRMNEMVMDTDEAAKVFEAVGVDAPNMLESVVRRTEGWPVGIYLTALAIGNGALPAEGGGVHGDDTFLADYLKQELFERLPEDTRLFLLRTSILRRLSGGLCDFVLQTNDSAGRLSELENSNLLIVPQDRTRTWYRYHSLLQDFLRSEFERRLGNEHVHLHSRAATWLYTNQLPEFAIEHADAAGENRRFAEMVAASARPMYAQGRMETLAGWLQRLEDTSEIANHPELAALGAFARALDGDPAGSERIAAYCFTDRHGHQIPDHQLGPFALMLRSLNAARGPSAALADARAAFDDLGQHPDWFHTCLGAIGLAVEATEGVHAADSVWAEGLWRSESIDARPFSSQAHAQRALASIASGDWDTAERHVCNALENIEQGGLTGYISSSLGFTLAARVASRAGQIDKARGLLASAAAIRPRLTVAIPLLAVQNLHQMARAFIELADMAGARRVMRDAADIIAVRPRLGLFIEEHQSLKGLLLTLPAGSVGASSLTTAELRLLPLLVTYLTYPEIGERLFVSRHTVKTQAMSIFRKLGVTSRADAVAAARETGLLSL